MQADKKLSIQFFFFFLKKKKSSMGRAPKTAFCKDNLNVDLSETTCY